MERVRNAARRAVHRNRLTETLRQRERERNTAARMQQVPKRTVGTMPISRFLDGGSLLGHDHGQCVLSFVAVQLVEHLRHLQVGCQFRVVDAQLTVPFGLHGIGYRRFHVMFFVLLTKSPSFPFLLGLKERQLQLPIILLSAFHRAVWYMCKVAKWRTESDFESRVE